jgi:hypothetical protein
MNYHYPQAKDDFKKGVDPVILSGLYEGLGFGDWDADEY